MERLLTLTRWHAALGAALDHLQSPVLLATRCYVAWQFLKSGWLKLSSWDTTLWLFRDEYRVPLLPPEIAAVAGTGGELFFPLLLVTGLFGRVGAVGLSAVNVMAVVSYAHVLLAKGSEAALGQHLLWGFMLAVLVAFGCGRYTADAWLGRHAAARCRPPLIAGGAAGG